MEHNFTKEYFEQERKKVDELIRLASVKRSPKTGKDAEALTNEIRERAKYFSQNPEEAKKVLGLSASIDTEPVINKPVVAEPVETEPVITEPAKTASPEIITRKITLPTFETKPGTAEASAPAGEVKKDEKSNVDASASVAAPAQTSPAKTENGDKYIDMSSLKVSPKAQAMGVEMKAGDTKDAIVTFDKDGKARLAEKYKDVEITPDMDKEEAYYIAKARANDVFEKRKTDGATDSKSYDNALNEYDYYNDLANYLEQGVELERALELAGQSDFEEKARNVGHFVDTLTKGTTHQIDSALNLMDEIDIATKTKVVDPIVRNAKDFWAKLTGKEKNENDRIIWKPSELIDNFIGNAKEEKKKTDADYEKAMKEHVDHQKSDIAAPNPYNNFSMGENGYYDPEYTLTHSKPGRFVTDAAYQGGRMIPSIAAGGIAGTAAKAVGLTAKGMNIASKIASNGTLFANVYTNAKARAINEGASLKQAENYAFISATIETAVENISSGIAGFGTGVLDNMGFKAIKNVTNPVVRGIFKGVGTATGEAIEEMGAEVLDVGARKFTYDPKATVKLSDVLYAGALGAFISAPGAVTGSVNEYTVTKSTYDALNSIIEAAGKVSTPAETSAVISFMDSLSAASADIVKDIDTLSKTEAAKKYGVSPEDIDRLRTDALITKLELSRATKAMSENMYSIFKANEESGVASEHENEVIARITSEIKNGNVDSALSIAQNEIDMNTQAMRDIASRKSLSDADKASMTELLAKRNTAREDVINHIKSGNVERLTATANPGSQARTESTDDSRADTPRLTTPANDTAAPVVENATPAQNEAKPGADEYIDAHDTKQEGETLENSNIVLEQDEEKYPYDQQKVIDGYESAVNNELLDQIEKVKKGDYKDNDIVYFSTVSDRAANEIKNILGIDVTGFKSAIEARQIKHILKRHGENGIADTSMRNDSDIARIEFVLENFDNIKFGGTTEAYTTMKNNGRPKTANTVEYSKKINGTFYVVQAIPDTKRRTLYVVSAFIDNKNTGTEQLADVSSPDATSKNGFAQIPATDSISHNDKIVNRSADITTVSEEAKQNSIDKAPESGYNESVTKTVENEKNTPDSISEETPKPKKTNDLFKKLTDSIPLNDGNIIIIIANGDGLVRSQILCQLFSSGF